MKDRTLSEFIKNHADEKNLCYNYKEYSTEIQESLKNIYSACFRFGLYASQTLHLLDNALKPFEKNKVLREIEGMFDL